MTVEQDAADTTTDAQGYGEPAAEPDSSSAIEPAGKAAAEPAEEPAGVADGAGSRTEPAATEEATTPAPPLELYFIRHADAGDPAEWPGDDADRPLSKKGRKQARRLGRLLQRLDLEPDVVVTSPKLRAADTARLVARRIRADASADARLGGGLEADGLAELVGDLDGGASRIVLVGHDPDFSDLVSWLSGFPVTLRKGALARVDVPGRTVGAGRGSLRWLLPPDAVPG